MLFRRKKQKDEPKRDEKKKNLERDRLQKAEEAYLERLAGSIKDGNFYVKRPPRASGVERDPDSRSFPLDDVEPLSPPEPPPSPPPPPPPPPSPPPPPPEPPPPRSTAPPRPSGPTRRVAPDPPSTSFTGLDGVSEETMKKVIKPGPQPDPPTMPSPAPPVSVRQARPTPPSDPPPEPPPHPAPKPMGVFPKGTILQLGDGTIAIYCEPVKAKGYEVAYILRANGKAQPEGLALYAYEAKKIGEVPEDLFEEIRKTLRWDRDAVCFHLDKYKYCDLIPQVERRAEKPPTEGPKTAEPKPDPPTTLLIDPARELVRGRRVYISFGPGKTWESVYWGKDFLGHIVAHKTHNEWALMHLDIKRFRNSIEVGEILKPEDMKSIQQAILSTQERQGGD